MTTKPILEIDAKGWSRIQGNQPKFRLFLELYQNSKDEVGTTEININIEPIPSRPQVRFSVTDDGPGFADLSHAYTLFAPSAKLGNPLQNGFMNMGEKAVIVGATKLTIFTTSGTVEFDMEKQTRSESFRRKSQRGTLVEGIMKMTREEAEETIRVLDTLIVPPHITLKVNGKVIQHRKPLRTFPARLPTRIMEEGELVTRTRDTEVSVYEVLPRETPTAYEMGIPVVDVDLKYHVSVGQKVLLNKDRDNLLPSFLQTLRVLTLNNTADLLKEEDASEGWVRDAAGDERAEKDAVERVLDLRFTKERVTFSPDDPEANKRAVAEGKTLIHGRTLSEGERANARRFDLIPAARDLFPTPKPYSDDPTAPAVEVIPESDWTPQMKRVVEYSKMLARELMGVSITVRIVKPPISVSFGACYGNRSLDYNFTRLGRRWFDKINEAVDELIIHEFGHEVESDHLSKKYHQALCRLGAKLKRLALEKPEVFRPYLD